MNPDTCSHSKTRRLSSRVARLLLIGILLALPAGGFAEASIQSRIEAEFGAYEALQSAVEALGFAVSIEDKTSVAALVRYPLEVELQGERTILADEQAFVAHYDEIVTPELAGALMAENLQDAAIVEEGVSIAGGQVQLMPFCTPGTCRVRYWLIGAITPHDNLTVPAPTGWLPLGPTVVR